MTNSYDVAHGLSQVHPGPEEPVEVAQQDDTLARTGNTARDQEMYAAGIRTGEENTKHNAAIRAGAAPGVSTVEDEEEPLQLPYVVQRILKFAGQNQRFVTLPNLSAQQAIDLANWIQANLRPAPAAGDAQTDAARDVLAERQRQISAEGCTPQLDDEHTSEELARAAACYALPQGDYEIPEPPEFWPWPAAWWKPGERRRELVKSGALILAEIERLDRAAQRKGDA